MSIDKTQFAAADGTYEAEGNTLYYAGNIPYNRYGVAPYRVENGVLRDSAGAFWYKSRKYSRNNTRDFAAAVAEAEARAEGTWEASYMLDHRGHDIRFVAGSFEDNSRDSYDFCGRVYNEENCHKIGELIDRCYAAADQLGYADTPAMQCEYDLKSTFTFTRGDGATVMVFLADVKYGGVNDIFCVISLRGCKATDRQPILYALRTDGTLKELTRTAVGIAQFYNEGNNGLGLEVAYYVTINNIIVLNENEPIASPERMNCVATNGGHLTVADRIAYYKRNGGDEPYFGYGGRDYNLS